MKNYRDDKRVVMTLDAGGTNFVFSAYRGCERVVEDITLPANAHDLALCLEGMVKGFETVKSKLEVEPVAISFSFPGPADYPAGIIGNLPNLAGFRGGVALTAMLEEKFGLPAFVNNDGNLYALGEAMFGYLPYLNARLEEAGSIKRYKNLVGLTLGTGFGGGMVSNGSLLLGDNSDSMEFWTMSNSIDTTKNIEELVSIRAVVGSYKKLSGIEDDITPKDIFLIAKGEQEGDKEAALGAYDSLGRAIGQTLANVLSLMDGIAVIGGGVSAAAELFYKPMMEELRSNHPNGNPRCVNKPYFLDDEAELEQFLKDETSEIKVPMTDKTITYQSHKRVGVAMSKIGAAEAISIGAYVFAIDNLGC